MPYTPFSSLYSVLCSNVGVISVLCSNVGGYNTVYVACDTHHFHHYTVYVVCGYNTVYVACDTHHSHQSNPSRLKQ